MSRTTVSTLAIAALAVAIAVPAFADPLGADEAAALVFGEWFEGVPEDRIRPLGAEAVARLAKIAGDPAEAEHHAAAVELLGRAGGPGAYEAVAAVADRVVVSGGDGRLDRRAFRTRLAVKLALGHLARTDDRALGRLLDEWKGGAATRGAGRLDPARAGSLERETLVNALALSGRDGAAAALHLLAAGEGASPALAARAGAALDLHARSARQREESR